jgi:hypothetical protein
MRTTLALDDDLERTAQEFTGMIEKTALALEALKSLIERESSSMPAALGGTMPELEDIPSRLRRWVILADTFVWLIISARTTQRCGNCSTKEKAPFIHSLSRNSRWDCRETVLRFLPFGTICRERRWRNCLRCGR